MSVLQAPLVARDPVIPLQSQTNHAIPASGGVGDVHGTLHDIVVAVALLVLVPGLFLLVLRKGYAFAGSKH